MGERPKLEAKPRPAVLPRLERAGWAPKDPQPTNGSIIWERDEKSFTLFVRWSWIFDGATITWGVRRKRDGAESTGAAYKVADGAELAEHSFGRWVENDARAARMSSSWARPPMPRED